MKGEIYINLMKLKRYCNNRHCNKCQLLDENERCMVSDGPSDWNLDDFPIEFEYEEEKHGT